MRKLIVAGNWKLNKTNSEALELAKNLKVKLVNIHNVDVVLHPPFTALSTVHEIIEGSNIELGAQNVYWESSGAFTGETSAEMLLSAGCRFVIVGHSERRQYFAETNETVNKRLKTALNYGLIPIMCVGEMLEDRESGQTEAVVEKQIRGGLSGLTQDEVAKTIIAYEPVWAIGTGKVATVQQANDVHHFIRKLVSELYNSDVASHLRIQYGGSVNSSNAADLLGAPDIDGALVGGASLKADSFAEIIKIGEQIS